MNKDSKKILLVGILITLILGFLIVWIFIEDHKTANKTSYEHSNTGMEEVKNQNNTYYSKLEQNNFYYFHTTQIKFYYPG